MMNLPYSERSTIAADHPALAGHFPGQPVVPGVVLLDMVARVVRLAAGVEMEISQLRTAKFHLPVFPGDELTIRLDEKGDGMVRFRVARNADVVADGMLCVKNCG